MRRPHRGLFGERGLLRQYDFIKSGDLEFLPEARPLFHFFAQGRGGQRIGFQPCRIKGQAYAFALDLDVERRETYIAPRPAQQHGQPQRPGALHPDVQRDVGDALDAEIDALGLAEETVQRLDLLDQIIENTPQTVEFMLQPGDLMVADNLKTLHGRTALSDHPRASERLMYRNWIGSIDS